MRVLEAGAFVVAAALILAGLPGCASSLKVPDKVATATAVACIEPGELAEIERACPALRTDAEILELDDFKVVQALRADRGRAAECIATQRAAIAVCAKVPAAGPPPPPLDGRRE